MTTKQKAHLNRQVQNGPTTVTLEDNTDLTANRVEGKAPDRAVGFGMWNRNLGNFPVARDARTRLGWEPDGDGGWTAVLGDDLSLHLPGLKQRGFPKRGVTATDMTVLGILLCKMRTSKNRAVTMRVDELFDGLGWYSKGEFYAALNQALSLWRCLRLGFACWHEVDAIGGPRILPAPLDAASLSKGMLRVTINEDWSRLGSKAANKPGYFVKLPLRLPKQPHAQNLAFFMLTVPSFADKDGWRRTRAYPLPTLGRKLGITHKHLRRVLGNAQAQMVAWLCSSGGDAEFTATGDGVVLRYKLPPFTPRKQRGKVDKRNDAEPKRAKKRRKVEDYGVSARNDIYARADHAARKAASISDNVGKYHPD